MNRRSQSFRHNDSNLIELSGEILHRTDAAILFSDGTTKDWFPLSQIELADETPVRSILCPEWLALEKGFI